MLLMVISILLLFIVNRTVWGELDNNGKCYGYPTGRCEFNPYINGKDYNDPNPTLTPTPTVEDLSDPIYEGGK